MAMAVGFSGSPPLYRLELPARSADIISTSQFCNEPFAPLS